MLDFIKYFKVSFKIRLFSKVDTLNIYIVVLNFDGINSKLVNLAGSISKFVLKSKENYSLLSILWLMHNFIKIWSLPMDLDSVL